MPADPRLSPGRLRAVVAVASLVASHSGIGLKDLTGVLGAVGALGGSSPWQAGISLAVAAGIVTASDGRVALSDAGRHVSRLAAEVSEIAARRAVMRCVIRNARQDLLCLAFMSASAIFAFADQDTVQCLDELGLLGPGSEGSDDWWSELSNDAVNADLEYLKRLGDLAEERSVVYERQRLLVSGYPELAERVQWVSRIDESLGFDVLSFAGESLPPLDPSQRLLVEVKACGRAYGRLRFFLSRNEWETALRNADSWLVHFWRVSDLRGTTEDEPYLILRKSEIEPSVPIDVSASGAWTVCEIHLAAGE